MKKQSGRFVVRISPCNGSFLKPVYWTGCGWSASMPEALRFENKRGAEGICDLVATRRVLQFKGSRDYDLERGGKIDVVVS